MKDNSTILITGASGTVGSAVVKAAAEQGHTPVAWDRTEAPPLNTAAAEAYLDRMRPDVVFSLAIASQPTGIDDEPWRINAGWPGELAHLCHQRNIAIVHASTVMVYSDNTAGPITPDTPTDADTGYGYQKLCSEQYVQQSHPDAIIARLGWQIAVDGGNSMAAQLERSMHEQGHIDASSAWLPATSFVEDSAAAMLNLARQEQAGIYLINSNSRWNFFEIATALGKYLDKSWLVRENKDFVFDQRMLDNRVKIAELGDRLVDLH